MSTICTLIKVIKSYKKLIHFINSIHGSIIVCDKFNEDDNYPKALFMNTKQQQSVLSGK